MPLLRFWSSGALCQTLLEAVYATTSINNLFISRIEWMALRADARIQSFLGASNGKLVTACANGLGGGVVGWVGIGFHS